MTYFRRDLAVDSIVSGLLTGGIILGGYVIFLFLFPEAIHRWWMLSNISGIFVLGIPVEELLWALGLGMVSGPLWEFFAGLSFRKS